jgi:UDP-glucose 4-epimerase
MKNAIVTGANGFVGTWLVKKLCSQNVQVTAIIKDTNENIDDIKQLPGLKIVYCELSEIANLVDRINERGFDCFYHLAWVGRTAQSKLRNTAS